ncbi:hypothetical protein AAY473_039551 [Plecturocebus cupreus]
MLAGPKKAPTVPAILPAPEEDLELPPPYFRPSGQGSQHPSPDSTGSQPLSPLHTHSGAPYPPRVLPLWEAPPLEGGSWGCPFFIHIPFSSSDLYSWKAQHPPFSERPQALTGLLESVLQTQSPTWDDCQQLLLVLFTAEERGRIRQEAHKAIIGRGGGLVEYHQEQINETFPSTRTQWDPNTSAGLQALNNFHWYLLEGVRGAARKPTNLSKVGTITQGLQESPAAFLEHLQDAYHTYTPIDPEAPENQRAINLVFISQSASDIKRKLQKLEGFQGMNLSQLLEIAQKVFNNGDTSEAKQDKIVTKAVIAALQETRVIPRGQGTPQGSPWGPQPKLGHNQCEPRVTLKIEGTAVSFLVDTGAAHSVLTQPLGPLSGRKTNIQGATGKPTTSPWTTNQFVDLGNSTITHSFLVIPECPYPLLGQDLLHKLQANISFCESQACLSIPPPLASGPPQQILITCALSDECLLQEALSSEADQPPTSDLLCQFQENVPGVWSETNSPGLASHHTPVMVQLLATATPVQVRQYPMSQEARRGIAPHITRLLKREILTTCKSPWNTPLLPFLKPGTKDYWPPIFAFEWTDPDTGVSGQLTWTRLPQGFKNSPTLFDEALSQDLVAFRAEFPKCTLLQYMDDLLLATKTQEACKEITQSLLKTLQTLGYQVSAKKAQLCQPKVTYLGYIIEKGIRALAPSRVQVVLQIPTPTMKRQVREFLGAVGYCRLWILGFAEIAKPLYACTGGNQPLTWTEIEQWAFDKLKTALTMAPALTLPDISTPFRLFVHEKQGVTKEVLTQTLGPWSRPKDLIHSLWVASLSEVGGSYSPVSQGSRQTNLGTGVKLSSTPCDRVTTPWSSRKMYVKCSHSSISGFTFGPALHKVFKGYSFKPHHAAT